MPVQVLDQEPGIASHHAEHVVKVVGNTPGQLRDALEPSGPP